MDTKDLEAEMQTTIYDSKGQYLGLTDLDAKEKLKEFGPNALTEKK